MLTLALLLACSAPNNTDGDGPAGKATQEDVDALLDRLEALEAEVAALRNAGAPVGIDADADGDGLREWDGLPVGTRRGDVLWAWSCPTWGYHQVDPPPPSWMKEPQDSRMTPGWACYVRRGDGDWSEATWAPPQEDYGCDQSALAVWECLAL